MSVSGLVVDFQFDFQILWIGKWYKKPLTARLTIHISFLNMETVNDEN